jgi:hypothetical protein
MSALEPTFIQRIVYFSQLIKKGFQAKNVFLLGGERKLDDDHERATLEVLGADAREMDMLEYHVRKIKTRDPHLNEINFIKCSTPYQTCEDGSNRRPNTEDTVRRWRGEYDDGGSVLCLTNQPYVYYQTSVVRNVLWKDTVVFGAGPAAETSDRSTAIALDTIARLIYTSIPVNVLK